MQTIKSLRVVGAQLMADNQTFLTQGLQGQLAVGFTGVFCYLFGALMPGKFNDVVNAGAVTETFLARQETVALHTIGKCQDTDGTLLGDQPPVKTELLQQYFDFIQVELDVLTIRGHHNRRNSSGHPLPSAASTLTGSCTALESPCILSRVACNVPRKLVGTSSAASTTVS